MLFKPLTDIGMQNCQSEMLSSLDKISKKRAYCIQLRGGLSIHSGLLAVDGYAPATRSPARAGDSKKEGGSKNTTRFLAEVSQSSQVRVYVNNVLP